MKINGAAPKPALEPARVYATPTLTRLGGLAEMTASGCSGPSESAARPACLIDTNRKSNVNC